MSLVVGVFPLIATGKYFSSAKGEAELCIKHWWSHALYVNNDVDDEANGCMGVTWYMANDMQFYWVSPFIIYPIWLATKYLKKHGVLLSFSYVHLSNKKIHLDIKNVAAVAAAAAFLMSA